MKKLNNKGVTLIELIVSFAIVGVAIIYFYQTLSTVNKLYMVARVETQKYVDKQYVNRILHAYINDYENNSIFDLDDDIAGVSNGINTICTKYSMKCKSIKYEGYENGNNKFKIVMYNPSYNSASSGKTYTYTTYFFKYISQEFGFDNTSQDGDYSCQFCPYQLCKSQVPSYGIGGNGIPTSTITNTIDGKDVIEIGKSNMIIYNCDLSGKQYPSDVFVRGTLALPDFKNNSGVFNDYFVLSGDGNMNTLQIMLTPKVYYKKSMTDNFFQKHRVKLYFEYYSTGGPYYFTYKMFKVKNESGNNTTNGTNYNYKNRTCSSYGFSNKIGGCYIPTQKDSSTNGYFVGDFYVDASTYNAGDWWKYPDNNRSGNYSNNYKHFLDTNHLTSSSYVGYLRQIRMMLLNNSCRNDGKNQSYCATYGEKDEYLKQNQEYTKSKGYLKITKMKVLGDDKIVDKDNIYE